MKLKHLAKIDTAIAVTIFIIMSPVLLVLLVLTWAAVPLKLMAAAAVSVHHKIGNRLVGHADEVRDGTIRNTYHIQRLSASQLYHTWQKEEKQERKEETK